MLTQLHSQLLGVLPSQAVHYARIPIGVVAPNPVHYVLDLLRCSPGLVAHLEEG